MKAVIEYLKRDHTRDLLRLCLAIWLCLWPVFFFVPNKKGEYKDFLALVGKDLEGKRAYLLGQDYYDYIRFCRDKVPPEATYRFSGMPLYAVQEVRAIYYLWPLKAVEKDNEYYFVYGDFELPDTSVGWEKVAQYSDKAYILKRVSWK
jgi:hypothetical protein